MTTTARHLLRGILPLRATSSLLAALLTVASIPICGGGQTPAGNVGDPPRFALELDRCLDGGDAACFKVRGRTARSAEAEGSRFGGRLDAFPLMGPAAPRLVVGAGESMRLLVVFDISGSMLNGNAIAVTRSPLRAFLSGLPPEIAVAVVPFESRGVVQSFQSARFVAPARVGAQLDALVPRLQGNTALYSAISLGLSLLDAARPTASRSALMVITDGTNDVGHRGDDPGLLDDAGGGRARVQAEIAASGHLVTLIGAGAGVRLDELQALAGTRGRVQAVPMDPLALQEQFEQIGRELISSRLLAYALPAEAKAQLGRRSRQLRIEGLEDSTVWWRPPLVALPPFVFTVDSTLLSRDARRYADAAGSDTTVRLAVGIPLLLLLIVLRLVLPRALAKPEPVAQRAAGAGGAADRSKPGGPERAQGALMSALEAPPRTPADITRDSAVA